MARGTRSRGIAKARKTSTRKKSQKQIEKEQQQQQLEQQYKDIRKKLQQRQRYYKQRGMLVGVDLVPKRPKVIKEESIRHLQRQIEKVRPTALKGAKIELAKGERINLKTGEVIGAKPSQQALDNLEAIQEITKKPDLSEKPQYPTFDVVSSIRTRLSNITEQINSALESLERKEFRFFDLSEARNYLVNLLDETIAYYEDNMEELTNYYEEHEADIFDTIDHIESDFDSDPNGKKTNASIAKLARLINRTDLLPTQKETINNINEALYWE